MRGPFIIGFAVFLDLLQLMLGFGILMMQTLPFVGQAAAVYGAVVDVVLSLTLGSALMVALVWTGMFYPGAILASFILEGVPILNTIVPGFTGMAIRCVRNKNAEEKAKKAAAQQSAVAQTFAPQPFNDIRAANDNSYVQQAAA